MSDQKQIGQDWSSYEVNLIVADYFDMLAMELNCQNYSKTAHRNELSPLLNGRSSGSIEFKHQNISGVLVDLGLPYIDGYKPRGNYQEMLGKAVEAFLLAHPSFFLNLSDARLLNPENPVTNRIFTFEGILAKPPDKIFVPTMNDKPWIDKNIRQVDFAALDSRNRKLGSMGEQIVLDFEKYRLANLGRDDLARKVVWASKDIGDGLGFDILSYDEKTETELMLEVKSTGLGKYFPFYVTNNELRCSEDIPNQFKLYRVFNIGKEPKIYILHGALSNICKLEPILYRASI